MDNMSVIGTQLSFETNNSQKTKNAKAQNTDSGQRISDMKKVAKEMEALFAYQLIKIMRETSNNVTSKSSGPGNDTYMGLFDMEISRLFSERGLGLQDAIIHQLERMEHNSESNNK